MTDNTIDHVRRVSRKYLVLFNVLLVGTPVAVLLYWVFFNSLPEGFHAELPVLPMSDLSGSQLILGALVSLLPLGVTLYGLVTLKALFRLYADAVMFSIDNVKYFRRLGYIFIAWVIANTIFTPLISLVMTYSNPAGERTLVAQFGIVDLFTLIAGGVILVIAWVMNEGGKLKDEQEYTV